MSEFLIRTAKPEDAPAAYHVCLKTGNYGQDGEPFYLEDPDALGRIFVGPYLAFEPGLSLVLEDDQGVCGYALGAFDSRNFFGRYEKEWRPSLCAKFPKPIGDTDLWTRTQQVHHLYHHPDYYCPEPYETYPSHLHIDLLARARGGGHGRQMLEQVIDELKKLGSLGAHLGVSLLNEKALGFYLKLGFVELIRVGERNDCCIYMGKQFKNKS